MSKFGICGIMTDAGIQPTDLARWVEGTGFDSLWFGEHTHAPTAERSAQKDPVGMDQLYDPYLTLAAAAGVTSTIKLGVAVSLVPVYHPIHLAKTMATLDRLSGGRAQFGVGGGGGRNPQEVLDFGVAFEDRWKMVREYVRAIRTIWANDVAEFDGEFVKFGPMRCWPKPVQPNGPPVLEGAMTRFAAERIAEYGDGWLAIDNKPREKLVEILAHLDEQMKLAGRDPKDLQNSMIMILPVGSEDAVERIRFMQGAGFGQIIFLMSRGTVSEQEAQLQWFAELKGRCS